MEQIRRFVAIMNALIGAAAAAAAVFLRQWLLSRGFADSLALVTIAMVVFLCLRVGEATLQAIIKASPWTRRVLMRSEFVEGTWVEVCLDVEKKRLAAVSVVEVGYDDNRLTFGGEVFSPDGSGIGNFDSIVTGYRALILWYVYSRAVILNSPHRADGRGEVRFTRTAGMPLSYHGSFYDLLLAREVTVAANRVCDKGALEKLRTRGGRMEVVRSAAAQFIEGHPEYVVLPPAIPSILDSASSTGPSR